MSWWNTNMMPCKNIRLAWAVEGISSRRSETGISDYYGIILYIYATFNHVDQSWTSTSLVNPDKFIILFLHFLRPREDKEWCGWLDLTLSFFSAKTDCVMSALPISFWYTLFIMLAFLLWCWPILHDLSSISADPAPGVYYRVLPYLQFQEWLPVRPGNIN